MQIQFDFNIPNPAITLVEIWLVKTDKEKIKLPLEQLFSRFIFTDVYGTYTFELELIDTTWGSVLDLFNILHTTIEFRFGYVNGPVSPLYTGHIMPIEPSLDENGERLLIKGFASSILSTYIKKKRTHKGKSISEIVKKICEENKGFWNYTNTSIVDTEEIFLDNNGHGVEKEPKLFIQDNKTDLDFIKYLATLATSKDNKQGDFKVYFEIDKQNPVNPPILNFRPINWNDNVLKLQYRQNINNIIKNFEPQLVTNVMLYSIPNKYVTNAFDPITQEYTKIELKDIDNKDRQVTGDKVSNLESSSIEDYKNETLEQYKKRIMNYIEKTSNNAFTATMDIIGHPDLRTSLNIDLTVVNINNTNSTISEWLSTRYNITRVDHIFDSSGGYECKLSLIANSKFGNKKDNTGVKVK